MDSPPKKITFQKSWIAVGLFALSTIFFAGMWYQSTKVTERDIAELKAAVVRLEAKVDAMILQSASRS